MRTLTLAALLVFSLIALQCKSDGAEDTNKPAGEVVALTGVVSATSAQKGERTLAVGDTVYRKDRIASSADSSVDIRLHHNSAMWRLGGAREVVVDMSPAWRAKLASAELLDPASADETGAAGRHSERQAGEQPSTLLGAVHGSAPPAPDDALPPGSGPSEAPVDKEDGFGSESAEPRPQEANAKGEDRLKRTKSAELKVRVISSVGALDTKEVDELLTPKKQALAECLAGAELQESVSLAFAISKKGKVAAKGVKLGSAKVLAKLKPCVADVLASTPWPTSSGPTQVRTELGATP